MDNFQDQLLPQHPSDEPTHRRDQVPRIKPVTVLIISSVGFLIIIILSITIMVAKKTQPLPSGVTGTTFVTHKILTSLTTATSEVTTSFFGPIDTLTTSTSGIAPKPTTCQLPLIPKYNTSKTVVAGTGSRGSTVDELNGPAAMVLDSAHNLYVLDAGNIRVLKYFPNAKKGQVIIGHTLNRSSKVSKMQGLIIDKNDQLHMSQEDSSGHAHVIIWPSLMKNRTELLTTFGRLSGFAIDQDLNIYIAMGINLLIWLAPTYKETVFRRVFGESDLTGMLPTTSSDMYLDLNRNLFAIDIRNYQIQKISKDDEYADIIIKTKPVPLAIVADCHSNLYTINAQSALIIYNSNGEVISTMNNTIDNPYNSDSWEHTYMGQKTEEYIPDHFATMALDSKNGDLYVIMYGYDKVAGYNLI